MQQQANLAVNAPGEPLATALRRVLRSPLRHLVAGWNWKAASISAALRATTFLVTNLHAGSHRALRAMGVEACFAVLAAGVLAAFTQQLRRAQPVWATGLVVWLGLPALLVAVQAKVHHLAGTPHVRTGLIASFCFAALASGFNWFAQRRGVFLAGAGEPTNFTNELRALPQLVAQFLLVLPRSLRDR